MNSTFTVGRLIELALGPTEARNVDTAIPLGIYNSLTTARKADVAGWYYDKINLAWGRLLTQTECWAEITELLKQGRLEARFRTDDTDIAYIVWAWPCLRFHVESGDLILKDPKNDPS